MGNLKSAITNHPYFAKIVLGLWLFLIAAFVLYKGVFPGWHNTAGDFNNYYVSSVLVSQGEDIEQFYDNDWFFNKSIENGVEQGAKFAPFPPITAFLYRPLSGIEFMTAKRIWLLFNVFLLFLLPFRIKRIFKLPIVVSALIISLFFVPLASNFNFGQAYLLLTFFLIEAVGLAQLKAKQNLAAIIVGICALLKYLPLLFIFYLFKNDEDLKGGLKSYILKQKWLLFFGGTLIIVLGATYLAWPNAYSAYFSTFSNHMQGDLSGQGKFAIGFQSLDSLLNNLFVPNIAALVDMPILKPIIKGVVFLGIGWTCFRVFKQDSYKFTAINTSIFIFGAFALIPASASYHFLFLLIPVVSIFKWLMSLKVKQSLIVFVILLLATFFIQAHHIPEINFSQTLNYVFHYPRLWCLLLLFGYLSYTKLSTKHG